MVKDGNEPLEDEVPLGDVIRVGVYAAIVAALVVFGIGAMLRAYSELDPDGKVWVRADGWLWPLVGLSLASALVAGALVIGWRLMHRRPNEPRWGLAMVMIALVLFAALVWPTPWAYREYDCEIVQVNRFTGEKGLRVPTPLCDGSRPAATRDPATPAPAPTGATGQPTR